MLAPQDNHLNPRSYSSVRSGPSGSGSRGARIPTSCVVRPLPRSDLHPAIDGRIK